MNILICGVGGRMGREVAKLALDGVRGAIPVAGYDILPVDTREFPTYTDWNAVTEQVDCIIDFSHHTGSTFEGTVDGAEVLHIKVRVELVFYLIRQVEIVVNLMCHY